MNTLESEKIGGLGSWFIHRVYDSVWIVVLFLATVTWPLWAFRAKRLRRCFWKRSWPEPVSKSTHLWVHAVSVGELKIAINLMKAWDPDFQRQVLLTTSTPEGMDFARQAAKLVQIRYMPWDLGFLYRRLFSGQVPPDLVLIETEIWPNLNIFVTNNNRRICVVNGRLGPRTVKRRTWRLFREAMARLDTVLSRSEEDARRFRQFGIREERIFVTGNIKYDFTTPKIQEITLLKWVESHRPLVVFASISNEELDLLVPQIEILKTENPHLNFLWAPRQLSAIDVHLRACAPFSPQKRSELEQHPDASFLVLDTMGELAGCFGHAEVSLVGGSFDQRGGQNFLESLQAGTPALLGPNTENFRKEVDAASAHGAIQVLPSAQSVAEAILHLLRDRETLARMTQNAKDLLAKHRGAIARSNQTLLDLGIIFSGKRS